MNKEEFEKVFAAAAEKSGVAGMARAYRFAEKLQYMMIELRDKLCLTEQPTEELEKVATALTNEIVGELNVGDYTDHSGHNAHWHSFKKGVMAGAQWQKEQMMKSAVSIGYLQDWYQNSIDGEVPPIWTDEHLNELTKDFYIIPKQKEDNKQ